eukprot:1161347-Pelagomonas_calceolata.AAC.6
MRAFCPWLSCPCVWSPGVLAHFIIIVIITSEFRAKRFGGGLAVRTSSRGKKEDLQQRQERTSKAAKDLQQRQKKAVRGIGKLGKQ